jgi:hypothetical protein
MMRCASHRPRVATPEVIDDRRSEMTETPQARTSGAEIPPQTRGQEEQSPRSAPRRRREIPPEPTGWTGWVTFGAMMLIMVGSFQILMGVTALFESGYYAVPTRDLLVNVDYTAWGWVHIGLGTVAVAAAVGLLAGRMWARVVAIFMVVVSSVVQLAFLAAAPLWSVMVITLGVLVVYAIAMHGSEVQS